MLSRDDVPLGVSTFHLHNIAVRTMSSSEKDEHFRAVIPNQSGRAYDSTALSTTPLVSLLLVVDNEQVVMDMEPEPKEEE
jgi:hypothetical protein